MHNLLGRSGLFGGSPFYPVGPDCNLCFDFTLDPSAKDHSLYGNHATIYGSTPSPIGLTSDGIDDYLSLTPSSSLDPGILDYAHFFWCNASLLSTGYNRFARFFQGDISYGVYFLGQWPWNIMGNHRDGTPPYPWYYDADSGIFYDLRNAWHFFGYEVDRDVGGYLSLDGVLLFGPLGDLRQTAYPAPYAIKLLIGGDGPLTMDQVFWFKGTFGSYSGKTRLQLFNGTKERYGL